MRSKLRASLQGLRVVSFESRRAKEMVELIRRYGGEPIVAPSMREIPLDENRAAVDLLPQLESGGVDLLILTTGVGTQTLNQVLLTKYPQERIIAAPVCTQVLERFDIRPDIEPAHPKMGSLIAEIAGSSHRILASKRAV